MFYLGVGGAAQCQSSGLEYERPSVQSEAWYCCRLWPLTVTAKPPRWGGPQVKSFSQSSPRAMGPRFRPLVARARLFPLIDHHHKELSEEAAGRTVVLQAGSLGQWYCITWGPVRGRCSVPAHRPIAPGALRVGSLDPSPPSGSEFEAVQILGIHGSTSISHTYKASEFY
jgi:hypothetical protein